MALQLRQALAEVPVKHASTGPLDVSITGIAIDSRAVKPGNLFVALRGGVSDGHEFVNQAIANGAGAVAGDRPLLGLGVPYVRFSNAREALTWVAAAFYGWPARKLTVIGVTGTDGKTTTTNLIYHVLREAGIKAGMISTVNAVIGDTVLDTGFHVTTPDAHDVQAYLARMVEAGLTHVVLETTSHGWAQYRVDACEFDIGVLTNITHEHLDQHGTYANYRAAKARLFQSLERTHPKQHVRRRLAVINRDDSSYEFIREIIRVDSLSYGLGADADLRAVDLVATPNGIRFTAAGIGLRIGIEARLPGTFNASNCLAALATVSLGLGIAPNVAAGAIAKFPGVPGRMERIEMGQEFVAIVDFAHTPNALNVALQAARGMLKAEGGGRVIAVFGSAGLRDQAKRRLMAEGGAEQADLMVLTAEDPRTESLDSILEEMAAAAVDRGGREGQTFWRVPDRGEALRLAVHLARPHDVVVSCGKGHEQSMCFGSTEYPWDDRTAMRASLAESLGIPGPDMPYLPTRDQTETQWKD